MIPDQDLLIKYHNWANRQLLDAVLPLSNEEWTRDLGSSFPSVQATAAHLIGVEWIWLERWKGKNPVAPPKWMDNPSATQLGSVFANIEKERTGFLHTADFKRIVTYRLFNGSEGSDRLGALVYHVVNHSSYHRGQLVTLLRQLGKQPPSTDFLIYMQQATSGEPGT